MKELPTVTVISEITYPYIEKTITRHDEEDIETALKLFSKCKSRMNISKADLVCDLEGCNTTQVQLHPPASREWETSTQLTLTGSPKVMEILHEAIRALLHVFCEEARIAFSTVSREASLKTSEALQEYYSSTMKDLSSFEASVGFKAVKRKYVSLLAKQYTKPVSEDLVLHFLKTEMLLNHLISKGKTPVPDEQEFITSASIRQVDEMFDHFFFDISPEEHAEIQRTRWKANNLDYRLRVEELTKALNDALDLNAKQATQISDLIAKQHELLNKLPNF